MKLWYVRLNNESHGPYTIEELKALSIEKDDYLWKEGLTDWVQAESIPELNTLFTNSAPPVFTVHRSKNADASLNNPSSASYYATAAKKNRSRRRLMGISLLLVLSLVTYLIYANNQTSFVSPFSSEKSPEQLRSELVQTEQQNPGKYISGRVRNRENLIGQTVVEGTLTNSATIAVFKDVVIQVDFISKTNSIMGSKKFTVYQAIHPGEAVSFKEKAFAGKDVADVHVSVVSASAVE